MALMLPIDSSSRRIEATRLEKSSEMEATLHVVVGQQEAENKLFQFKLEIRRR